MDTPQPQLDGPKTPRRQGWLLQSALLVTGVSLIAISAALLVAGWNQSPPRSEAAGAGVPASPEAGATPAQDITLVRLGAEGLYARLVRFVQAHQPPFTPTPRPSPTPAPPAEPPAPAEAASEPEPEQPAAPPPAAEPSCPAASMAGFALDLFNAINAERTAAGLPALAADPCVAYVAQLRSSDMATNGYFKHTSPNGSDAFSLMDANGVRYGWAGENLARNNYPAGESVGIAIRDLMASLPHRENILRAEFTAMGVAMVDDGTGMRYYTMVFVGPPV